MLKTHNNAMYNLGLWRYYSERSFYNPSSLSIKIKKDVFSCHKCDREISDACGIYLYQYVITSMFLLYHNSFVKIIVIQINLSLSHWFDWNQNACGILLQYSFVSCWIRDPFGRALHDFKHLNPWISCLHLTFAIYYVRDKVTERSIALCWSVIWFCRS